MLDEVRISSVARGDAWIKHSYENQKSSTSFLTYDLNYLAAPVFSSDLNITVVSGEAMSYQIRTQPPAISYTLNGSPPTGLNFNPATGVSIWDD